MQPVESVQLDIHIAGDGYSSDEWGATTYTS